MKCDQGKENKETLAIEGMKCETRPWHIWKESKVIMEQRFCVMAGAVGSLAPWKHNDRGAVGVSAQGEKGKEDEQVDEHQDRIKQLTVQKVGEQRRHKWITLPGRAIETEVRRLKDFRLNWVFNLFSVSINMSYSSQYQSCGTNKTVRWCFSHHKTLYLSSTVFWDGWNTAVYCYIMYWLLLVVILAQQIENIHIMCTRILSPQTCNRVHNCPSYFYHVIIMHI